VIKGQTGSLPNFFLLDEKPRMESDGKVIYGSGKIAFSDEKKANFAARTVTTHHFDAAANWIEGEFSSILRLT
jgi:hypothetical protein